MLQINIHSIENIVVKEQSTIRDVISVLNQTGYQIVLVVNLRGELIGTVTDGDIRRSLLRGISLEQKAVDIANLKPKFVFKETGVSEIKKMFLDFGIKRIPIVNEKRIPEGIYFIEDFIDGKEILKPKYSNTIVIMAGGRGTRLDPLTRIIPKPLVPIGDKTMIERIMERFYEEGFSRFIVTVNYKKEMMSLYLKGLNVPYEIHIFDEGNSFLGTAGALGLLMGDEKLTDPFILTNCDVFIKVDLSDVLDFHTKKKSDITVVGALTNMEVPYGIMRLNQEGEMVEFHEKPSYDFIINTGIYIISKKALKYIKSGEVLDMPELLNRVKQNEGKVLVYPVHTEFLDIGQWEIYRKSLEKLQSI